MEDLKKWEESISAAARQKEKAQHKDKICWVAVLKLVSSSTSELTGHDSQLTALPISAESCEFIPTSSCLPQESGRSSPLTDVCAGRDLLGLSTAPQRQGKC